MEIVHVSPTDNIDVCLINAGDGAPFISLLEVWPLANSIYRTTSNSLPLDLMARFNLGMSEEDSSFIRSWRNRQIENSETISALETIHSDETDYKLPNEVLGTAIQSQKGYPYPVLFIHLNFDIDYEYHLYLHFFDFVGHPQNQLRKMYIAFDANLLAVTLKYQEPQTIKQIIPKGLGLNKISIVGSPDSSLPPMINALEIFRVLLQPNAPTHEGDVDAMRSIKHAYNITRIDWQGDPCMPRDYRWEGLNCNSDNIPRVTSLDLSNNPLTGEIPQFLVELPNLKRINLSGNNLTGSIPKALREKNGTTLILSLDGNPGLCQIGVCRTKTQKSIIPIIASVAASVAVLVILACISVMFCKHKMKKQMNFSPFKKDGELKSKNLAFNHFEVLSITNHFETVIGEGGFGKVYLGTLQDDTQVAIKLLSKSSQQGFKEFQSEVELLMVVHHRNLVSLVGYCNDGDMKALVYEYMPEGNLRQKLSDKNPRVLKWNERLQIAWDTACGLDYLHNGCKPAIIHRDLKTSNILLSKNMQAKIADFGLSRAFLNDTDTKVSTCPAGTLGYLDPEFHSSGNLNKKSDVYSFGIILLELITGRPAIMGTRGNTNHISNWVRPRLESGDIQSIVDPRLEGKFNAASAWKFLEIGISCIPPISIQRPDMGHVVAELKECLASEISLESAEGNSGISGSASRIRYFPLESNSAPCAR
ncbi:probable leucine-rich repeat receptor-like protein kinase At2g28990 [Prosopis cineraria]|uniref:probable leucine-rich repeat receptor-like protein kinase At2g28990 n=1 Tax=Prosopis cineraria TaxID=364024 RepID=UPI00240F134E|nr:probable leucine-rich repeat receptor-like protein kinase At2g28990 [Prosopis cineraria]